MSTIAQTETEGEYKLNNYQAAFIYGLVVFIYGLTMVSVAATFHYPWFPLVEFQPFGLSYTQLFLLLGGFSGFSGLAIVVLSYIYDQRDTHSE